MLTFNDVKTVLHDVCEEGIQRLSDEELRKSRFCYELNMDSLDYQEFLSQLEVKTGNNQISSIGADKAVLSVEEFIRCCNH